MALNYINPGWTNDDEPYIDADNLNDISDNLEEACDLIGNTAMTTTATTITGAVNELDGDISTINGKLGTTAMGTTATTVTGAINELLTSMNGIGSYVSSTNSTTPVDVLSGTTKAVISMSVPAGKWLVIARARFAENSTGTRHINVSTASNGAATGGAEMNALSAGTSSLFYVTYWAGNAEATLYLLAYQNCGSALRIALNDASLLAIKL